MAAETESVELGDRVRAAGRVDMEFKTALPALRHYLENILAAFSYAVSSRDDHHLGELIGGVEVRLKGCTTCSRSLPSAQQIISWFSLGAAPRRQTATNLSIHFEEGFILYSALYQDWETTQQPRCAAIGTYHGRFKAGPQVWKWVEHTSSRISDCSYACPRSSTTSAADSGLPHHGNPTHLAPAR